jgi:hypothetical protein
MTTSKTDADFAASVLGACVEHGRQMLASQLPLTEGRNYDFMPNFKEMTTQLYLVGVMWRFGEQFKLPTAARDRGFICLISMLVGDGMSLKKAQRRIARLNEISRAADGQDTLAITVGYRATEGDGTLANIFDHFRNVPEVSGAPHRLLDRAKPIAVIVAGAAFAISLLIGSGWGVALGIGIVVGVSALGIALAIYRQMVKPSGSSS